MKQIERGVFIRDGALIARRAPNQITTGLLDVDKRP